MKNKLTTSLLLCLFFCGLDSFAQGQCISETINFNDGNNRLSIPNGFTPNGDGVNDVLPYIFVDAVQAFVSIYDASENVVHSETFLNNPNFYWNGANAAPGKYSLFLNVEFQDGAIVDACRYVYLLDYNADGCINHDINTFPLLFPDQYDGTSLYAAIQSNDQVCAEFNDIEDLSIEHFQMGPNPAKDYIYLNTDQEIETIQILDLKGEVVLSSNNTNTLSISSISRGMYLIQFQSAGHSYTKKFVKE